MCLVEQSDYIIVQSNYAWVDFSCREDRRARKVLMLENAFSCVTLKGLTSCQSHKVPLKPELSYIVVVALALRKVF